MKVFIGPYPKGKSKAKRKISVRINKWDTWCLDVDLARIIAPALKLLRKQKAGAPGSLFDVSYLNTTVWGTPEYKRAQAKSDKDGFKKWNGMLDAMIWSFDEIARGSPNEPECNPDNPKWQQQMRAYQDRVATGTKLFGEWYGALWT